ncbi:hypothetical protein BB560_007031 [Smittium megazygosporum]|uniref:Uncharacterized protein n=2 Tax=Smittium megazygosporum TaxID=133381 RepID=A0A2T9XZ88_9FUNG|nr:hypothetical protein BB560_007031 [Smittium megazygosporum]
MPSYTLSDSIRATSLNRSHFIQNLINSFGDSTLHIPELASDNDQGFEAQLQTFRDFNNQLDDLIIKRISSQKDFLSKFDSTSPQLLPTSQKTSTTSNKTAVIESPGLVPEFIYDSSKLDLLNKQNQREIIEQTSNSAIEIFPWLIENCKKIHVEGTNPMVLCNQLLEILASDSEDIETDLLDVVGFEHMEFLSELILNRQEIKNQFLDSGLSSVNSHERLQSLGSYEKNPSITLHSDFNKYKSKKSSKASERQRLETTHGSSSLDENLPHVYTNESKRRFVDDFGNKISLPIGSVTDEKGFYREVSIPGSRPNRKFQVDPVKVKDMDYLCKNTFVDYKQLNPVQSIVYPTVYKSNENVLVCAPTGAGKTEIGMLAILKVISSYLTTTEGDETSFKIEKNKFKIVYVAPMKALASEIVRKYSEKLKWIGITVKEFTGDSQLTKKEVLNTNIIVTTPEKWDVITRKLSTSEEFVNLVRLLIIDEVHLLQDERGPVLESIVARTFQTVENTQSLIRVIGLSATCPNYLDVASFLKVNPKIGLFYFGPEYRPVPLEQHFVGIKNMNNPQYIDQVCYDKVIDSIIGNSNQVMVFVHTRKDTVKSASDLLKRATSNNELAMFSCKNNPKFSLLYSQLCKKSKNKELLNLVNAGFGIHNAGMLRGDRRLVETMFSLGLIRVLCCTSTLAWGVNLPANCVIIKGTQVYSLQKGGYSDLSVLDVLQIFGRAGRPQYVEDFGTGYILTSHDKMDEYIRAVSSQSPIESMAHKYIIDMLNAEIVLGTATTIDEAATWLGYTFMFVRMRKNPSIYGSSNSELESDPTLFNHRRRIVINAAKELHRLQMIIYDEASEQLQSKELGRIASQYYLSHKTVERFVTSLKVNMSDADLLSVLCMSNEFDQLTIRQSETAELVKLVKTSTCCEIKGFDANADISKMSSEVKTNILLQAMISQASIADFGLISDTVYISTNANRIARALFEIAISRNYCLTAINILILGICIEKQLWPFEHPLAQFNLPQNIISKLHSLSDGNVPNSTVISNLRTMSSHELGDLIHHKSYGPIIYDIVSQFPIIGLADYKVIPITEYILQIDLDVVSDFEWSVKTHGGENAGERFYYFLIEQSSEEILYHDYFFMTKSKQEMKISFSIKMPQNSKPELILRVVNDRWLGSDSMFNIKIDVLSLPANPENIQTPLLDLVPLPVSIIKNEKIVKMYSKKFSFFNPIQTQLFDTLFNSNEHVLLGAPTGSGKTLAAELAMLAAFAKFPRKKVVYIAPLKALVKERVKDWGKRLYDNLGYKLVELSGDVTPDYKSILESDIIVTTPEKWDGISRRFIQMDYVKQISLVILDEIHLLGSDRGPILEVIVSRMNYIAKMTRIPTRIIGLSTSIANALDLASWIGIKPTGLFNFSMSIRLVPLTIFIEKFGNKHYCPRMNSMNKPAFRCIKKLSPNKPVIIFVSSRRQTRLTANDIISYLGVESNPKMFLNMTNYELEQTLERIQDPNLSFALAFGIGLHHAGLTDSDRITVEKLFEERKIQVLVATSTLAWGVNLPAHLVIVKGTEFFDTKIQGYKDMPMTDVLQMIGRAGRPQFDNTATAVVYVYEPKFYYYKKFLFAKFPIESNLPKFLNDHINAEINSTQHIGSLMGALEYLCETFFINRLKANPNYYGLSENSSYGINKFLTNLILRSFDELHKSNCISFTQQNLDRSDELDEMEFPSLPSISKEKVISKESKTSGIFSTHNQSNYNSKMVQNRKSSKEDVKVFSTINGKIASKYYISHMTLRMFDQRLNKLVNLKEENMFEQCFNVLCWVHEWMEIPVRHNEDKVSKSMNAFVKLKFAEKTTDFLDPRVKTNLVLQYYLNRQEMPMPDFVTDCRTILDSSIRILQAMIDYCALVLCDIDLVLSVINVGQCIKQACWFSSSVLDMFFDSKTILKASQKTPTLFELKEYSKAALEKFCENNNIDVKAVKHGLDQIPYFSVKASKTNTSFSSRNKEKAADFAAVKVSMGIKISDANKKLGSAYTPRFGKFQFEGYFIIISERNTGKIVKLVRVTDIQELNKTLSINFKHDGYSEFWVDVVSDCYLGMKKRVLLKL